MPIRLKIEKQLWDALHRQVGSAADDRQSGISIKGRATR